jgi:hypothetical protein
MAQHRLRSERKNGSNEVTTKRQPRMADRVHTSLHRMQSPGGDAMLDRPRAETESQELPPCDDSVLPLGEIGDDLVEWQQLTTYFVGN